MIFQTSDHKPDRLRGNEPKMKQPINYKEELKQKPKMSKYWGIQYLDGHKSISETDHPLKVEDQFRQIYHNATLPVKSKKDPKIFRRKAKKQLRYRQFLSASITFFHITTHYGIIRNIIAFSKLSIVKKIL